VTQRNVTQQNVTALRKIYDAFVTGDIGYIIDQLADDVHWHSHVDPVVRMSGDWSGKTKVPDCFRTIVESLQITSFAPTDFYADGDVVVSTGRFGATARATGKAFESAWVFIFTFSDGKVVSYEQFHGGALPGAFH
jgi:ketosteroid isomerase-like protein